MSAAGKRYARAAVEAAMGNGGIEAVQKLSEGLGRFRDAYVQSSELREVLSNPALKDVRESVLRAILTKLDTSTETVNLVLILAENDSPWMTLRRISTPLRMRRRADSERW